MRVSKLLFACLLILAAPARAQEEITAIGPNAPLAGTLEGAGKDRPVILIIPGSGPTDRDGNNSLGITAQPYRLLAKGLAARGIATVRIDKRGLFGSKAAIPDANAVTLGDYAGDVHNWVASIRQRTGAKCVWILGHSEGGLVALTAAQQARDFCGLILVSTGGRPFGEIVREQLRANPAYAPILPQADAAIDAIMGGVDVDVTPLHPGLKSLFAPAVQGYLKTLFPADPVMLVAAYNGPVLIVQGTRDLQIGLKDAQALRAAQPRSTLALIINANHVLKAVASADRGPNLAAYRDPSLPVAPGIIEAITAFVTEARR